MNQVTGPPALTVCTCRAHIGPVYVLLKKAEHEHHPLTGTCDTKPPNLRYANSPTGPYWTLRRRLLATGSSNTRKRPAAVDPLGVSSKVRIYALAHPQPMQD